MIYGSLLELLEYIVTVNQTVGILCLVISL